MKADEVTLISQSYVPNAIGVHEPVETEIVIPVDVRSVTRSEWEAAGQQGLNPAHVLITHESNYGGQEIAEFHGLRYGIYRTYVRAESELIELYLARKAGLTNGQY